MCVSENDRFIDWSIRRLSDSSVDQFTDSLIDELIDSSVERFIVWSIDQLIDSSYHSITQILTQPPTHRVGHLLSQLLAPSFVPPSSNLVSKVARMVAGVSRGERSFEKPYYSLRSFASHPFKHIILINGKVELWTAEARAPRPLGAPGYNIRDIMLGFYGGWGGDNVEWSASYLHRLRMRMFIGCTYMKNFVLLLLLAFSSCARVHMLCFIRNFCNAEAVCVAL